MPIQINYFQIGKYFFHCSFVFLTHLGIVSGTEHEHTSQKLMLSMIECGYQMYARLCTCPTTSLESNSEQTLQKVLLMTP